MPVRIRLSFKKACKNLILFICQLLTDFYKGNGLMRSSSLAFTIMLAIAPFCVASASILSFLPVFHNVSTQVLDNIVIQLSPVFQEVLRDAMHLINAQAYKLSFFSFVFLFVTSLMMLFTIETHVNEIWNIKKERNIGISFLMTWGLMLVAPLLFGVSILLNTYLASLSWLEHTIKPGLFILTHILAIIAFTILYKAIPIKKVHFKSAFFGAVSTDIMFTLAKYLFVVYIERFSSDSILYGPFAVLPLFMLWIYICAILFLLNAKLVHLLNIKYYPASEK